MTAGTLEFSSVAQDILKRAKREDVENQNGTTKNTLTAYQKVKDAVERERSADSNKGSVCELLDDAVNEMKFLDDTAEIAPASDTAGEFQSFADWLKFQGSSVQSLAVQCVAEMWLHLVAGEDVDDAILDLFRKNGIDDSLLRRFCSLQTYSGWVSRLDKNSPEQELYRESCELGEKRLVTTQICVPVLFASEVDGMVAWLCVEVFQDSFRGLLPDFVTLASVDFTANNRQICFLKAAREVWDKSGLADKYSGRWRIVHRPPLSQKFLFKTNYSGLKTASGDSAQAALLVALLAAAGKALEDSGDHKDGDSWEPQQLNPACSITARLTEEIEETDTNDSASSTVTNNSASSTVYKRKVGAVGGVLRKLSAVERYGRPESGIPDSFPSIDSMLVMKTDYEKAETEDGHCIKKAKQKQAEIKKAKQKQAEAKNVYYGIHYRPVTTIQDALDWMLVSNRWREAYVNVVIPKWEGRWSYPRNKEGEYVDRQDQPIRDGKGETITEKTEWTDDISKLLAEHSARTGSLEYMRNPWGGAEYDPLQDLDEQSAPADEGDATEESEV